MGTFNMRIPVYIVCCHSCPLNLFTFGITGNMTLVGVEAGLFTAQKILDEQRQMN